MIDAKGLDPAGTRVNGHVKIDVCDFVRFAIAANLGGPHDRLKELLSKEDAMVYRVTRFCQSKFSGWIRASADLLRIRAAQFLAPP